MIGEWPKLFVRIFLFARIYLAVFTAGFAVNCPDEYVGLLDRGDYDGLIKATLSQYDFPPDIIIRVKADWPAAPREMGIEDSVLLLLFIDDNGDVLDALPAAGKRKTHPDFERAAVDAALKYKCEPAILNDEKVGIWYPIELIFYIEGK